MIFSALSSEKRYWNRFLVILSGKFPENWIILGKVQKYKFSCIWLAQILENRKSFLYLFLEDTANFWLLVSVPTFAFDYIY